MTYYFATYRFVPKVPGTDGKRIEIEFNNILRGVHPVKWAARPNDVGTTYLLFWSEIPEEVATDADVNRWVSIENATDGEIDF